MSDHEPVLSPVGQTRRDAILALALRRVRLRRRVRRAAGVTAVLALVVGALAVLLPQPPGAAADDRAVARIATTANAVPRVATTPRSSDPLTAARGWEVLDDQALLLALHSAGRPATITRSEGRARVVFAETRP